MLHDVFISYASEDKNVANAICAQLEYNQIRCWLAPRDILPGEPYPTALINAIAHSNCILVIFSRNSANSPHVMAEIERASDLKKIIILFRIEDIQPQTNFENSITRVLLLDAFSPPLEDHISELVQVVKIHLLKKSESEEKLISASQLPLPEEPLSSSRELGLGQRMRILFQNLLKSGHKKRILSKKDDNLYYPTSLPKLEDIPQPSDDNFPQKIPDNYDSLQDKNSDRSSDKLYISYASGDTQIAEGICAKLEEKNIWCWNASRDISHGETYAPSFMNAIDNSEIIVVILSRNSNKSRLVLAEIERAFNKGKMIIPILIEDIEPSDEMQYYIGNRHWLDAKNLPLEKMVDKLTNIKRYIEDYNIEKSQKNKKIGKNRDIVECTVFSPPNIALDTSILVQVFVHILIDQKSVKKMAKEFDKDTERRGFTTLKTRVMRESSLSFHLEMDGLEVTSPIQTLVWYGRPGVVNFKVTASKSTQIGNHIGIVTISQNGVPIGHIQFKVIISPSSEKISKNIHVPTGDKAIHYQKAFIAYSSVDRHKVLDRIPLLDLQGIEYHQDLLSLRPGDIWEEKLSQYIDECDLFLLFWSQSAKKSPFVRKEIKRALLRQGSDRKSLPKIVPVLIEGPPPVEPCEELRHIQFDDYRTYLKNSPH